MSLPLSVGFAESYTKRCRHDAMRLEKVLREAGIKADIKSIKPSSIPDLFAVTLADQPLYISRDGHYVVQGEVLSVPDDVILEIQMTR